MIRHHKSCVFSDFSVTFSGYGNQRSVCHGLTKPLMVSKNGFILMNELDISRYCQTMGEGMVKARKEKQIKRKAKKKERRELPDPVFQNLQHASPKPYESPIHLKNSYEKPQLVLLPVEPFTAHVYWILKPNEQEKVRKALGQNFVQAQSILRFYDVTNIVFDGTNALDHFDVPVVLQDKNCYVRLWSPQRTYVVELGWKNDQGHFVALAQSNIAHTPSAWPAAKAPHLPKGTQDSFHKIEKPGTTEQVDFPDKAGREANNERITSVAPKGSDDLTRATEKAKQALSLTGAKESDVDLSEISERAFASGIFSGIVISSPKGKNGQKD